LSDSIVAILPLSDKKASIVWSAKDHLSEGLMLLSIDDFAERLSFALEYRFGDLEVVSEVLTFPLIERSANEYAKDNLVLVGDAAHNIHPLAGQGVNLGFSDVEELTEQILSSDKPIGNYNTLRKYARSRRFENEIMAKTMTGLNWIYKENNEPLRWLRGIGMNIIDDNQSLKSFFQRKASGN
jgi:2-octaprenyl-3-methyl-6-methoxy-1,4-benzoquinol hydroxylase/2-octaprenylphenol hydroxylase